MAPIRNLSALITRLRLTLIYFRCSLLCVGWGLALIFTPLPSALGAVDSKPMVSVQVLEPTELFEPLSYPGVVKAKVQATVLAEAEGVVRKIQVPLGKRVKAGQSLLVIQQTDPVYQYSPVQVRAPVTGAVSELAVTEGARVNKGQKLATVTEPRVLKIALEIPAQDLVHLRTGMVGHFQVPGTSESVPVKVVGVSPTVDPATGTASAESEPTRLVSARVYPGLIGKVSFKANVRKAITVADDAIVNDGGKTFVRLLQEGKAVKVPVEVGTRVRGQIEITSGVQAGAKLIARASGYISDGAEVEVAGSSSEPKKTE